MEPLGSDERGRDASVVEVPFVVGTLLALASLVTPEGPREGLFLMGCFLLGAAAGAFGPWTSGGGDR